MHTVGATSFKPHPRMNGFQISFRSTGKQKLKRFQHHISGVNQLVGQSREERFGKYSVPFVPRSFHARRHEVDAVQQIVQHWISPVTHFPTHSCRTKPTERIVRDSSTYILCRFPSPTTALFACFLHNLLWHH